MFVPSSRHSNFRKLVLAETDFALKFLAAHNAQAQNFVFSPVSISLALALAHAGSKSSTENEIVDTILKGATSEEFIAHFAKVSASLKSENADVKTNIANRIFANKGFRIGEKYLEDVKNHYNATAQNLDFSKYLEAQKIINTFVSKATDGAIEELVSTDVFENAVALLVNAVYFKAKWNNKFDQHLTCESKFSIAGNFSSMVPFLRAYMEKELYASDEHFDVLTLRYADPSYKYCIFLPKQKWHMEEALTNLTAERFHNLLEKSEITYITYFIPKLSFSKSVNLKESLSNLGIQQLFSESADLSGIADNLMISDGIHQALIQVDEDGTTAAAATALTCVPSCAIAGEPVQFVADYPFIFSIVKDNHPLFLGIYSGV